MLGLKTNLDKKILGPKKKIKKQNSGQNFFLLCKKKNWSEKQKFCLKKYYGLKTILF